MHTLYTFKTLHVSTIKTKEHLSKKYTDVHNLKNIILGTRSHLSELRRHPIYHRGTLSTQRSVEEREDHKRASANCERQYRKLKRKKIKNKFYPSKSKEKNGFIKTDVQDELQVLNREKAH